MQQPVRNLTINAIAILGLVLGHSTTSLAQGSATCACPDLSCSPCEDQVSISFYTEACPGEASKMRSCKRPTCKSKDPLPSTCKREPAQALPSPDMEEDDSMMAIGPATATQVVSTKQIGIVLHAVGTANILRGAERLPALRGEKVFESDSIETSESGKVQVAFPDKNELVVAPNTRIALSTYKPATDNNRKAWFDLLYGKIRSVVRNKYDDGEKSFRVRTPVAVAGVRGTEFTVTHYEGARTTKIETLTGLVKLSSLGSEGFVEIPARSQGAFISNASVGRGAASGNSKSGIFTKVEGLNEKQLRRAKEETDFLPDDEDAIAANSTRGDICARPSGAFNQCSWFCMGNPQKSSTCRTDLAGVHCMRRRCNANGEWADEARLPASRSQHCSAEVKVGPCDY